MPTAPSAPFPDCTAVERLYAGSRSTVPLSELEYVAPPGGAGLVIRRLRLQHGPIVRGVVVDKHAGSLRFDTQAGVGTTFYLRLPIDDALESAA